MNESENRSKEGFPTDAEELVGRLLRLAGPRATAPEGTKQRVREAVLTRWRTTVRSGRRRRTFLWLSAALSAAALLTIGIALGRRLSFEDPLGPESSVATLQRLDGSVDWPDTKSYVPGEALPAGTRVSTGPDGRAALLLAGGASLRVDRDTRLVLISGTTVELQRGALYFDSGEQEGTARAFEIRTRMGTVQHRGTQFVVRLEERAMSVSVREGTATLTREDRSYAAPAGTRLSMSEEGIVETSAIPRQGADWEWVLAIAPAFDLEGKTLGEFLAWVTSETGWEVRFAEPSIAADASRVTLHGSVERMRPDQAPAAVLPTCGLSSHLDAGVLTVGRAAAAGEERRQELPHAK